MRRRAMDGFGALHIEGGLFPESFLQRVAAGDPKLPGMSAADYHLLPQERVGEVANRAWTRLLGAWAALREELGRLPEGDPAIRVTRDRWLLPLFEELGYGRLQRTAAAEIEGKTFAISHLWARTPIHLVGAGVSIDRRAAGVAGRRRRRRTAWCRSS